MADHDDDVLPAPDPPPAAGGAGGAGGADAVRAAHDLARREAYTKIPTFYGETGKDYFKPEEWVARVDANAGAAGWDNINTMAFVYNALRGRALSWYSVMKQRNVEGFAQWITFKTLFLESFSAAKTSKAVIGIFHGLVQTQAETVLDFFNRVGKAVDDMTALRPRLPDPIAAQWLPEVVAMGGWAALEADIKVRQALRFARQGATLTMEHVAIQLFIAGIKTSIQTQLLQQAPEAGYTTLWRACQTALEIEKNLKDANSMVKMLQPTGSKVAATSASSTSKTQEEELEYRDEPSEAEIAVLNRFRNWRFPQRSRGRGRGGRGGRGGGYRGNQSTGFRTNDNRCRRCGKEGHWQNQCPNQGKTPSRRSFATNQSSYVESRGNPPPDRSSDDSEEDERQACAIAVRQKWFQ